MWLVLLLPSFVFSEFTLFKEYREKHLNHSVSPCTHFFNHVCPKNVPSLERFRLRLQDEFESKLTSFLSEEAALFLNDLQEIYFQGHRLARDTVTGQERRVEVHPKARISRQTQNGIANEGELTVEELLWKLCPFFEKPEACIEENKATYLHNKMKIYKTGMFTGHIATISFAGLTHYDAITRMIEKDTTFADNVKKIEELFNCSKRIVLNEYGLTPWMTNQRPEFIELLRQSRFGGINRTRVDATPFYTKAHKLFRSCVGDEKGFYNEKVKICILKAACEVLPEFADLVGELEAKIYIKDGASRVNGGHWLRVAGYDDDEGRFVVEPNLSESVIAGTPVLFGQTYGTIQEMLGFGNFILSHEFGHTAFIGQGIDFMPSNVKCLHKQISEVCQPDFKKTCPRPEATFAEDSADYIAMRATLSAHKELVPNASAEDYQNIFYAFATFWCNDGRGSDGVHSANLVRVNGVLRQFKEFSDAFQCQKGDFMRIEDEDRCQPLFGTGSPSEK